MQLFTGYHHMEGMDGGNRNYHGYKQYVKQWTDEFEGAE
jgi:hypothetical protein